MKVVLAVGGRIPALLYGGTERVAWSLGRELTRMGHEVSYLAAAGSTCDFAQVRSLDPGRPVCSQIPDSVDLVHFHFMPGDLRDCPKPFVLTMHGNPGPGVQMPRSTIFVSENHASRYGASAFVHDGLDWSDYQAPDLAVRRRHFHFLGKAAWRVKNVKGAIRTIRRTRRERLVVMGGSRLNFSMGFRFTLSTRARFKGFVGGGEKSRLLNGSKGLVFPVRWHEPFGLAVTESLYYGCPVFGTPYGSLPELVVSEVGYLSNRATELARALEDHGRYSAQTCHQYAADRFGPVPMARKYLAYYERTLNGETFSDEEPRLLDPTPRKRLDWFE